ncbi:hypothetical protein Drorol1_Dr00011964 [Drosera rotundifolia]
MDSIPKLKKMERKMPKKGKKGKGDAMKAAYLNGCVFALLAWASKLVGFPRMFRWEEKKAPHNPESTLQLLANVKDSQIFHFVPSSNEKVVLLRPEATRLTACLDQLEKEFTKPSHGKIRRKIREKKYIKENQKVDFGNVDDRVKDEGQKDENEGKVAENEGEKKIVVEGEKKFEVEGEKKFGDEDKEEVEAEGEKKV